MNTILPVQRILFLLYCLLSAAASAAAADTVRRSTMLHEGGIRSYVVRVPPGLKEGRGKVPLVIVLHGGGGNAEITERMTGFTTKAAKENFIVVYPEGSSRFKDKLLTWNAGHCCGYALRNNIDDVGFIGALIDKLIKDYPVDPKRVYATGISNGGMMSHRLGIELPHKIAAIAPVVAALFGDEKTPAQPVSALMINGMLDKSIPHQGGPAGGRFPGAWDGTPLQPAVAQAEFWSRANRCVSEPAQKANSPVISHQYRCPGGKAVELILLKDTGHTWPGGQKGFSGADDPGKSLNATEVIWAFFKSLPQQ
jgi:polyhydroxybutyrate depolymerase